MSQIARKALSIVRRGRKVPLWFDTVVNKYPPLTFAPPSPVELRPAHMRRSPKSGRKGFVSMRFGQETSNRVPKMPAKIEYPEDKYRKRFLREHPEELYRPVVMAEGQPRDDPSEEVVQWQMQLMEERGIGAEQAYRLACEKYSETRLKTAIAQRIASEELVAASQTPTTDTLANSIIDSIARAELEVIKEANRQQTIAKSGINF